MREAAKTNLVRHSNFASLYLQGRVLDIGAGSSPVCPSAVIFEKKDGDANDIGKYFPNESFDTVHSSHCLEHMNDPHSALSQWWSLVKPGGFMIVVVPDEALYEQGIWPSWFNPDHRSSFRLKKTTPLSANSFDIGEMCADLQDAEVISTTVHDHRLDRKLLLPHGVKPRRVRHPLKFVVSIVKRIASPQSPLSIKFNRWLVRRGHPFDQTKGPALAQIEVMIRKIKM